MMNCAFDHSYADSGSLKMIFFCHCSSVQNTKICHAQPGNLVMKDTGAIIIMHNININNFKLKERFFI